MKMKKVYLNKVYDDGTLETDYFYLAEEEEKVTDVLRNIFFQRYVRSSDGENYTITDIDVCRDVDH